ncbi:DinB family protein [Flavobacterium sp.]|uniref:DinB family protein n=1 Tax=Flavobacterium sp. TaxID=239 RepID=UPI001204EBAB|nr:DinB family protein [Flavobacterium sp.]RZJ73235.1 MAG: DinB family protein [Flavobacterium sp.]
MKIKSQSLIDELLLRLDKTTETVEKFRELETSEMLARKDPSSWNLLECLEHLNRYGNFYLPEIEKRILQQELKSTNEIFRSGILGNFLVNAVRPKGVKVNKMKTAKAMNPIQSQLSDKTISIFLQQQTRLQSLLERSRKVDLSKTRTDTTLSRFITLRLGDTFRFMVNHIERHVAQAEATQF